MCYSDHAQRPLPHVAKGNATGDLVVLTAADGNKLHAYIAVPEAHTHHGVIVYPDARGLFQFYKDLAMRFAEMGVAAIALDYFGRTAGPTGREEGLDYMPHVQQIKMDTFTLDVQAAKAHLLEKAPHAWVYVDSRRARRNDNTA